MAKFIGRVRSSGIDFALGFVEGVEQFSPLAVVQSIQAKSLCEESRFQNFALGERERSDGILDFRNLAHGQ